MDSKVVVEIRDQNGQLKYRQNFESDSQFRVLWVDREGCLHVCGRLPWKIMRGPLRRWARDWAAKQEIAEVEVMLREHMPGVTQEEILILLEEANWESMTLSGREYKSRNNLVAYRMVGELLRAAVMRVKKVIDKTMTIWLFPQSPMEKQEKNSVRNWLFRR